MSANVRETPAISAGSASSPEFAGCRSPGARAPPGGPPGRPRPDSATDSARMPLRRSSEARGLSLAPLSTRVFTFAMRQRPDSAATDPSSTADSDLDSLVLALDIPPGLPRRPDPDAFAKGAQAPIRDKAPGATYSPAEYHLLRGVVNAMDPAESFLARLDLFVENLTFKGDQLPMKVQSRELFAAAASRFKETRAGVSIRDTNEVLRPTASTRERAAQRVVNSIGHARLWKAGDYRRYVEARGIGSRPSSAAPLERESFYLDTATASLARLPSRFLGKTGSRPVSASDSDVQGAAGLRRAESLAAISMKDLLAASVGSGASPAAESFRQGSYCLSSAEDAQPEATAGSRLTLTSRLASLKAPPGSAERRAAARFECALPDGSLGQQERAHRRRKRRLQLDIFTAPPRTGSYSSCKGAPPLQMD